MFWSIAQPKVWFAIYIAAEIKDVCFCIKKAQPHFCFKIRARSCKLYVYPNSHFSYASLILQYSRRCLARRTISLPNIVNRTPLIDVLKFSCPLISTKLTIWIVKMPCRHYDITTIPVELRPKMTAGMAFGHFACIRIHVIRILTLSLWLCL